MRIKIYSTFCLAIMVIYIIRPVMPYIEYAINKDYISKYFCIQKDIPNNCCHGLCYLNQQLKKNSEPIDANSENNDKNTKIKTIEDHLKSEAIIATYFVKHISVLGFYCTAFVDSYISLIFVPPN